MRIEPCPFCGAVPEYDNQDWFGDSQGTKWGFIHCCGQGPEVRTQYKDWRHWRDDAVNAWNVRSYKLPDQGGSVSLVGLDGQLNIINFDR